MFDTLIRGERLLLVLSILMLYGTGPSRATGLVLPPQVTNWTEYSNNIGPDKTLSITGNSLVFKNIGRFKLTFYRHYDGLDGSQGGDLYKIESTTINPNISQDYVPNETLGCSKAMGVGYVLLSETIDPDLKIPLVHFSSVPGGASPRLDDRSPHACLTSTWTSGIGNRQG